MLEVDTDEHAAVGKFGIEVRIVDRRQRAVTYLSSAGMQGVYYEPGETAICTVPFLPLVPGRYEIELWATIPVCRYSTNGQARLYSTCSASIRSEPARCFRRPTTPGVSIPEHFWTEGLHPRSER